MTFTNEQIEALKAPLGSSHVKSRSQAGRSLSYIEGWWAIAEANRIFGFDRWERLTEELKMVCEPYQDQKGNWRVGYMARVRIIVHDGAGLARDGCGFGSGIDRDLGQAHESALKEAETDAMKRALMTFGNPFGLALYDKDQANVVDDSQPSATQITAFERIKSRLEADGSNVDEILRDSVGFIAALPEDLKERLRSVVRFVREARKVAA